MAGKALSINKRYNNHDCPYDILNNKELLAKVFSSRLQTHPPLRVPLQGGDHNSFSRNLLGSPPVEGWPKAGVGSENTFATDSKVTFPII